MENRNPSSSLLFHYLGRCNTKLLSPPLPPLSLSLWFYKRNSILRVNQNISSCVKITRTMRVITIGLCSSGPLHKMWSRVPRHFLCISKCISSSVVTTCCLSPRVTVIITTLLIHDAGKTGHAQVQKYRQIRMIRNNIAYKYNLFSSFLLRRKILIITLINFFLEFFFVIL